MPPELLPSNVSGKVVDIVDAFDLQCRGWVGLATAPGENRLGAAVDPPTNTVYLMNSPQRCACRSVGPDPAELAVCWMGGR